MSQKTNNLQLGTKLYVDIISLLDLRLSVIKNLFPIVYKRILNKPLGYLGRISDSIDILPRYFFKEIYNDVLTLKIKELLQQSKLTDILTLINSEISILELKKVSEISNNSLDIVINTYPFNFTEEEIKKLTVILRTLFIVNNIDIVIINRDPKTITLKEAEIYNTIIMYDGLDWLTYILNIDKYNIPQVKLYIPALLTNGEIPIKKVEDLEEYFNNITSFFKPVIDISFVPVEYFSISPDALE